MIGTERLRELLRYDPDTGHFTWINPPGSANLYLTGKRAGHKSKQGYVRICIDKKMYLAHRLAWLYMTGKWPKDLIDHIDRVKDNNAFLNLREANKSINALNHAPDRYRK